MLFGYAGQAIPRSCAEAVTLRASASWPLRAFLGGPVLPCSISGSDAQRRTWVKRVDHWYSVLAELFGRLFVRLPLLAGLGLAAMLLGRGRDRQHDDALAAALFLGLCCFGYILLLALINAAEPVRFFANIQGLMIVCMVLATFGGLDAVKAALAGAAGGRFRAPRFGLKRRTD